MLAALPALLGANDDPDVFVPHHQVVAASHHRYTELRLVRTGLVVETLVPTILEQRITTDSARYAWRRLLRRYGEEPRARPSRDACAAARRGMADDPVLGMAPRRSRPHRDHAARLLYAPRLEKAAGMPLPQAMARLQHILSSP
ncbi:hypothetical protein ABTZ78_12220 [Streptomyces bauhiniae]|uniref:hypothetical protein n=1 Tax=Streptomyces bauhiniae TaxID=2340725 RepID=UPI00332FD15C